MIKTLLLAGLLAFYCLSVCAQTTFKSSTYSANNNLFDLSIGDLNGDTYEDIVVSNRKTYNVAGYFSVLLGKADGGFHVPSSVACSQTPAAIELGDFNGDNILDVVASQYYLGSKIMFFKGNGDGTFGNEELFGTAYRFTEDIALGHINNDNKTDIVTGGNELIFAFPNDGAMPFSYSFRDQIPNLVNSTDGISLSDVNKDGIDDIVTVNKGSGSVLVYIAQGNGLYNPFIEYPATTSTTLRTRGVWCDDFNGDTYPDIVVANQGKATEKGNHISVLLNKKDGTFANAAPYYTTDLPEWPVTADFNKDGFVDIAVSSSKGVNLFWGKGDGTFGPREIVSHTAGHKLKISDLNNDSYPDIAHATRFYDLEILYNCPKVYNTIDITACDYYVSPSGNYTWSVSGTYTDTIASKENCDSVITINLKVLYDVPTTQIIKACDSFYWPASGITYKQSGKYSTVLTSEHGCDSTAILELTINSSYATYNTVHACNSYTHPVNNKVFVESGDYTIALPAQNGCDSIIYMNLSLTHLNNLVTRSDNTLICHDTEAQVQWLDCNNDMKPVDNQNDRIFTGGFGKYAAQLTRGNCIDTSDCFVLDVSSLVKENLDSQLQIYPNPTHGPIVIEAAQEIEIKSIAVRNASGILVQKISSPNQNRHEIYIDLAPGLYFVEVQTSQETVIRKIMKR